jgi:hypothetical protein
MLDGAQSTSSRVTEFLLDDPLHHHHHGNRGRPHDYLRSHSFAGDFVPLSREVNIQTAF